MQRDATKRALNKASIAFDEADVAEESDALAHIKSLAYAQAPVAISDDDRWSGFRPDKVKCDP